MDNIAVIDLGLKDNLYADKNRLLSMGKEMNQALSTTGFCYLTNHGVDQTLIKSFHKASLGLFQQHKKRKVMYASSDVIGKYGWLGFDGEALNPERPPDIKEVFGYCPAHEVTHAWPEGNFEKLTKMMFSAFTDLCHKVLEMISYGLGWDPSTMTDAHTLIGQRGNRTALRTHYYPPLPDSFSPAKNQIRCGEHTDNGTMTFLVQDEVGGLEVLVPGRGYIPVNPIPGSIIVMVGSLLERWTSDDLHASNHRVVIPTNADKGSSHRQSTAYFVNPDDEAMVRCFDGKNKYEPIKALDYIRQRASESFNVDQQKQ